MDDPHRKPREQDRGPLAARIRRAADEGRIGTADRDIRLGNVASAQSMAELDLMTRDLDQLEATLRPGSASAPAPVPGSVSGAATPGFGAAELRDLAEGAVRSTARSLLPVVGMAVVVVVLGVIALGVFLVRGSDDSADSVDVPVPLSSIGSDITDDVTDDPAGDPSGDASPSEAPAGTAYSLTGPGIRAFLGLYRERFQTTEVVDLTLYDDYVVVDVPVPGKARHEGWLYRGASGFTSFGGVTANFPGATPVDIRDLDIPALVRNIAKARAELNVEDPTTTYAIVRYYTSADQAPSVDIHVANEFSESGYLATTLAGKVERAYAFGQ